MVSCPLHDIAFIAAYCLSTVHKYSTQKVSIASSTFVEHSHVLRSSASRHKDISECAHLLIHLHSQVDWHCRVAICIGEGVLVIVHARHACACCQPGCITVEAIDMERGCRTLLQCCYLHTSQLRLTHNKVAACTSSFISAVQVLSTNPAPEWIHKAVACRVCMCAWIQA